MHSRCTVFAFILTSLGVTFVPSAMAGVMGYNFIQEGFTEGATVTGMFFGEDLNGDEQLAYFPGGPPGFDEISNFMMEFSGNAIVPAFNAGFDELMGFVYDLNGGPIIGDGITLAIEGIGVGSFEMPFGRYSTGNGPGPFPGGQVTDFSTGATDFTESNAFVTPKVVPEPASIAVWGIILAVGGTLRRRRPISDK